MSHHYTEFASSVWMTRMCTSTKFSRTDCWMELCPSKQKFQPNLRICFLCSFPKPSDFSFTVEFHKSALCRIKRDTCKFSFCSTAFSSTEINPLQLLKLDPVLNSQSQTRSKPLTWEPKPFGYISSLMISLINRHIKINLTKTILE